MTMEMAIMEVTIVEMVVEAAGHHATVETTVDAAMEAAGHHAAVETTGDAAAQYAAVEAATPTPLCHDWLDNQ